MLVSFPRDREAKRRSVVNSTVEEISGKIFRGRDFLHIQLSPRGIFILGSPGQTSQRTVGY